MDENQPKIDPENSPQNGPSVPLDAPVNKIKTKGRRENLTNAGKGRPKGSLNKLTSTVKEAVEVAFTEVGGAEYLVTLARRDPRAFVTLLCKILPNDVRVEGQITHAIFSPDQLRRMADAQEEGESQIIDVTPIPTESDHE